MCIAIDMARKQNISAVAIVLNLPEQVIQERNTNREDHSLPARVVKRHCNDVKRSLKGLKRERFRYVYVINSLEQLENVEIVRTKLWCDKKDEHGPFDIIGDVHGCAKELEILLEKLGYIKGENGCGYVHLAGRKAVFLGDFCDRGNHNVDVLKIVMEMVKSGNALAVTGNHDVKLLKYLRGKNITVSNGLDKTIAEIDAESEDFKSEVAAFIDGLVSHYVFDDGKLVIAHAGIRQEFIGRTSGKVRDFCLYGDTTGEVDSDGLHVRLDWAADYRDDALVVYGHLESNAVRQFNNTICIDTGCVFGGKLTALRYPEKEFVSVAALEQYCEPIKPLAENSSAIDSDMGDVLMIDDFGKKMHVTTELILAIDIHENNAAAALEIMTRFGADPHWLIYLPPTMSPCETSTLDGYLEYPEQAFEYFRSNGIRNVVCEKKHMGSRAVIVLCRNAEITKSRFGVDDGTNGIIYTRTGRRFFYDGLAEKSILDRLNAVLEKTGFWNDFETDWVCLDTELMPWSDKAQRLLRTQYAPTGAAGIHGLLAAVKVLEDTCNRSDILADGGEKSVSPVELLNRYRAKLDDILKYRDAYREYCWTVESVNDYRIAPFHVLACEGRVFDKEKHVWHMETIKKYMTGIDNIFVATPYAVVDTEDDKSVQDGIKWWLELTGEGGEGMVVKPETYLAVRDGKIIQPAVKCRGSEYLRIIYGAEYLEPEHLKRLKKRSLNKKRTLALKEFALGMESLKRFVNKEPLYRVHEYAFGVLAFESEPVDPIAIHIISLTHI